MDKSSSNARGFVRHGDVAARLRQLIVSGQYAPGSRLPVRVELQQLFDTTPVTLQRALDRLRGEGFVRTEPNAGTFVTDRPPHLWRYGLLFADHPPAGNPSGWSRFYTALETVARRVNESGPRQIEIYHGVDGHADSEGYQRLLQDMATQRLAGLMFGFYPHDLLDTPMMELDYPRVTSDGRDGVMPLVGFEWGEPVPTALRWIAAQGRRKVSIITLPQNPQAYMHEEIEKAGLTHRPYWVQAVHPSFTGWVRHAVHGILHSHPEDVPDAMLVTDDHLVEAVADALIHFGVRVPQDMLVVGHWNFPLKFRRDLPVQLIGQDNTELMRRWVMTIDAMRRGERVPFKKTVIQPVLAGQATFRRPAEIQQLPPPSLPVADRAARATR